MLSNKQRDLMGRSLVVVMLLVLMASGVAASLRSLPLYQNYWGGIIYGPIAIVVALLGIYIVIFKGKEAEKLHREERKKGYKGPLNGMKW